MPGPNDGVLYPVGSNERNSYDRQLRARNLSNQNRKSMYNADGKYDYSRVGGSMPSGTVDYATALRQGQTQRQEKYDDRQRFINSPIPQLADKVIKAGGGEGLQKGTRPVIPPSGSHQMPDGSMMKDSEMQSSSPAPTVSGNVPQSSDPRIQRLRNKAGNSRPPMQNSNRGLAERSNRRYGTQQAHDNFNDMSARMTSSVNTLNARNADARGGGRRNKAGRGIQKTNRNAPAPAPGTVAQGQFKS